MTVSSTHPHMHISQGKSVPGMWGYGEIPFAESLHYTPPPPPPVLCVPALPSEL